MDKQKTANDIIEKALPLVAEGGWNQATLMAAAVDAGYKKTDVVRVFPNGAVDAVEAYARLTDAQMLEALSHYNLETMKIRQKITSAVRLRLELQILHREAVKKAVSLHSQPFNYHRGVRSLYATVDAIWRGIGDTSTDYNFYTKRLTLAGVYSSTLLIWLDDNSVGQEVTWAFLDRRIEGVMKFETAKHKIKNWLKA